MRTLETLDAYLTLNEVPNPRCCNDPNHLCPKCEAAHSAFRPSGYSNIALNASERNDLLMPPRLQDTSVTNNSRADEPEVFGLSRPII